MRKYFYFISTMLIILTIISCSSADAKENTSKVKSNAFDKIDKRDKKLFTQEERIKSYNNSINKSESIKASLEANKGYNGYGSKAVVRQTRNKSKKISKPKLSSAEFSAYSTN